MMKHIRYALYIIECSSCIATLVFHIFASIIKCQEIIEQYDVLGFSAYVLVWSFTIIIAHIASIRITGNLLGEDFKD